tara:strand:- start:1115 stop:1912 length:798 start_codon:yes stop_codon:yes gene_type:complete
MSNLTDWGLPKDYVNPSKIGPYLKLDPANKLGVRLRILGSFKDPRLAIRGFEGWEYITDEVTGQEMKRPHRVPMSNRNDLVRAGREEIKHFWALAIYNYTLDYVQCWQINQSTIQTRIEDLVEIHGAPNGYDLQAIRTGTTKKDTKYVIEKIESKGDEHLSTNALEESTIDLRQLFVGGDIMTPLEEKASEGDSEKPSRAQRDDLMPIELVRNQIEAAQNFEQLDEALMLKDTYVKRGDISKAEQMTLKSIEAKVKERLTDEEVA